MPQVLGQLVENKEQNGRQIITYDIPALTKHGAKAKGRLNARLKSVSGASISSVDKIGKAGTPGMSLYQVTITSTS